MKPRGSPSPLFLRTKAKDIPLLVGSHDSYQAFCTLRVETSQVPSHHLCMTAFCVHVSATLVWTDTHAVLLFPSRLSSSIHFSFCQVGNPGSCQTCCYLQLYQLVSSRWIAQTGLPCYCWLQAIGIFQLLSFPRC